MVVLRWLTMVSLSGLLRKRTALAMSAGALLLLAFAPAQANASSHPAEASQEAPSSPTITLALQNVPRTITVLGALLPKDQARLSVKVSGRLDRIFVDIGSVVRKGDPIAQLDKTDYELALRQAEAALAQAQARAGLPVGSEQNSIRPEDSTLVREALAVRDEARRNRDRIAALVKDSVLPAAEAETVEAAYIVAQSKYEAALQELNNRLALLRERSVEVDIARQRLADTTLAAPFEGAIRDRLASPGEYLESGESVATLVRINPLRLRVEIPERQAAKIRPGLPVKVRVEGSESHYEGQLTRISPSISETNRMLIAEAELENDGRLRPGAFVRAEVVVEQTPALLVPRSAVHVFAGVEKLHVIENGKSVEKTVRTSGQRFGDQIEIISGAKPGDVVVRSTSGLTVSGQR